MAAITQFAQPGVAFMQAYEASRDNRLARSQAEAEAAAERARQQMRQQAFQSIVGTGDNQVAPDVVAAQLASAGLLEDARLAESMGQRQQARQRQMQEDESEILSNASQGNLENLDAVRRRLQRLGSPLATAPDEELRPTLQAYGATQAPVNFQRTTAINPATGRPEIAFVNPRTQAVTFSGLEAPQRGTTVNVAPPDMAGFANLMTASQQGAVVQEELRATNEAASAASNILRLSDLLESQMEQAGPGVTGVIGSLRQNVTGFNQTVNQLSQMGPQGSELASFMQRQRADAMQNGDEEMFDRLFNNPQIAGVDLLRNTLNYAIARMNDPNGRLSDQDVSRNSLPNNFFTSDEMFRSAIGTVRSIAEQNYDRAYQRNQQLREDPYSAFRIEPRTPRERGPAANQQSAPQGAGNQRPRPTDFDNTDDYLSALDEFLGNE